MKIKKKKQFLKEEIIDNKTYLFRGESKSNYHNRAKTTLNSRYYAFEAFDTIGIWGKVVIYELLNNANILEYEESVEDFVNEYDLTSVKSTLLKKLYGVNSLDELTDDRSYHDIYHARQIIATEYLETKTDYDGCIWYEWSDTPEYQIQIWNNSVVRKLPYKEAREVIDKLGEMYPDIYAKEDIEDFWNERYFELKK